MARSILRMASEFEAASLVTKGEGLRAVGPMGRGAVAGAVAGGAALVERGDIEAGTHAVQTEREPLSVTVETDRSVTVDLPEQRAGTVPVSAERIAGVLGIDRAAMDDVRADLPIGYYTGGGGTLLAPVNFLEHLGNAAPSREALATLLSAVGATRLCAFTFDTLGRETDVHARAFDPAASGCERATSGAAVGACGTHLSRHPVFDADRESIRVECGRFVDRPATVVVTLADAPAISGTALTVLDGTVAVPPPDDDEILDA